MITDNFMAPIAIRNSAFIDALASVSSVSSPAQLQDQQKILVLIAQYLKIPEMNALSRATRALVIMLLGQNTFARCLLGHDMPNRFFSIRSSVPFISHVLLIRNAKNCPMNGYEYKRWKKGLTGSLVIQPLDEHIRRKKVLAKSFRLQIHHLDWRTDYQSKKKLSFCSFHPMRHMPIGSDPTKFFAWKTIKTVEKFPYLISLRVRNCRWCRGQGGFANISFEDEIICGPNLRALKNSIKKYCEKVRFFKKMYDGVK